MKASSSLARRILVSMLLVGILPIVAMSFEDHYAGKGAIMDSEKGHLSYALNSRLDFMRAWLAHTRKEFLQTALSDCALGKCRGEIKVEGQRYGICSVLDSVDRGHAVYDTLALYDTNWKPIVTTRKNAGSLIEPPPRAIRELADGSSGLVHGAVYISEQGHPMIPFAQPTFTEDGDLHAYVVGQLNLFESLGKILGDSSDIGETGKFYMLDREGRYLWTPAGQQEKLGTHAGLPETLYRNPHSGVLRYHDPEGREVLGVSAVASEDFGWVLLAQVEVSEAYALHYREVVKSMMTGLLALLAVSFLVVRTSHSLAAPLKQLAKVSRNISKGNLKERVPEFKDLETKEVGEAFNTMLDRIETSRRALVNQASLAAIGGLSSSIVHEMRNPLSSIKMNLEALEEKVQDDPVHAEIALIGVQQANRLETMLSDLMQYGKPLHLNLVDTRFRHLADNVIHAVSQSAADNNVSIEVEDGLGSERIKVDNEKMVRALTNLVDNGIYWSPNGGTIRIIGTKDSDLPGCIHIRIIDQGPGIPPDHLDKIFNLFFSSRQDGTGIGLANVRKTVEYHGGRVFCANNNPAGAVFTVELPVGGPES